MKLSKVCFSLGCLTLAGCATGSKTAGDPQSWLEQVCRPGQGVQQVKGSIWLTAKSKEASGKFPALVDAQTQKLRLEATNLTGGTEATITVDQGKFIVVSKHVHGPGSEGQGSWGGIPLRWATELFVGHIPCPAESDRAQAHVSRSVGGELVVEVGAERFIYVSKEWAGAQLATSLHWESSREPKVAVDFKFSDPEDGTNSPKKWEARSAQGEVTVRWREREVVRNSGK